MQRAAGVLELLDAPHQDEAELRDNLVDLEVINRWLGGARPIVEAILERPAQRVLDVGSGGADIPRALARAARSRGRNVRITCVDQSMQMIDLARANSLDFDEIDFVHADGTGLPFDTASFDIAMSSATLHHCEPDAAVAFLSELRRVAKLTPLVGDLRRTPLAYAGARAIATISRNRLTKSDAPLSVQRSYTPREAYELARSAGWKRPSVRPTAFFRMLLYDAG
jgi:ubiquinone/menaquinone biosynthesis C-methylase UbiE